MIRKNFRFCLFVTLLTTTCTYLSIVESSSAQDIQFEIRRLAVDANEGIGAADVDGDGKTDLIAGRSWYANGQWDARPLRLIEDWNGYVQSNGDYILDVNQDGFPDVVAGSFLPTEIHWYENPGKKGLRLGQLWKQHLFLDTKQTQNEGGLLEDLDGDGAPELVIDRWKKDTPFLVQRVSQVQAIEAKSDIKKAAKFKLVTHEVGPKGNGHGLGIGDINGDGRKDILVGQGWYEQPEEPWNSKWNFHADWEIHASLPMIVTDLTGEGRNDLILGNGHDYGLFWWENLGEKDGKLTWEKHEIDSSFSQPHTLAWADLTGDGHPELITGKRYYAHNGKDPGGEEMPCLYYFTWDAKKRTFTRHTIDEGHVGTGLQIVVQDLDDDGDVDLAVAGKSGTYLLTNTTIP